MDGAGNITGRPTTVGTYYINATLTDPTGAGTVTRNFEIIVMSAWTSQYPSGSTGWCQARIDNLSNLTNVITELASLQGPLSALDDTTGLTGSNQPSSIQTRVKSYGGYKYLIASNTTGGTVSPTFTWHTAPELISVYNEGRNITPSGATFTDSFGPYAAHVYQITDQPN
jgi:hypothetical protein